MRDVYVTIEGLTPLSLSRHPGEEKNDGEQWEDYEKRIWRRRAHVNDAGNVVAPGVFFKLALDEGVKKKNEKIKGKGHQTYSGLFASGTCAMNDIDLGVKLENLKAIQVYCHSNGKRGPGGRVMRWFPFIPNWGGQLHMRLFNDAIPKEVFEEFFEFAGVNAGVGRGRPSTGCAAGNGRFKPIEFKWS